MGYYSTVSGDIKFERPTAPGTLSPRVLAELQGSSAYNTVNFFFAVNADGLTSTGESGTAYELVTELRRMVGLLATDGAVAHGTVLVEGEARDDVWRVIIDGAEVREEHAVVTVTWPSEQGDPTTRAQVAAAQQPAERLFEWLP